MVSRCVAMVDRMLRRATRRRLENFWNGQSSDTVNRQGSSVHKKYRWTAEYSDKEGYQICIWVVGIADTHIQCAHDRCWCTHKIFSSCCHILPMPPIPFQRHTELLVYRCCCCCYCYCYCLYFSAIGTVPTIPSYRILMCWKSSKAALTLTLLDLKFIFWSVVLIQRSHGKEISGNSINNILRLSHIMKC